MEDMIKYTGFGIVMGFLVNRGLFTPQIQAKYSEQSNASEWNVVTGQKEEEEMYKDLKEMTEEEKEMEAERLFVLFERLNKAGIQVELKKNGEGEE